jgi:hypothetical protein
MMSKTGEIRRDNMCLDYNDEKTNLRKKDKLLAYECHGSGGNQIWHYENGLIKHNSGLCLEISRKDYKLFMNECHLRNDRQIWRWKHTNDLMTNNASSLDINTTEQHEADED